MPLDPFEPPAVFAANEFKRRAGLLTKDIGTISLAACIGENYPRVFSDNELLPKPPFDGCRQIQNQAAHHRIRFVIV
jgi:hypothetical protein